MKVLVIGAGIGGLATALCLCDRGVGVEVFEQGEAVRELGVGMNVLPPAVSVLAEHGLVPALDRVAIRTAALLMTNRQGQAILSDPRGVAAGLPSPQFSIHRGHLQRVLLDAVTARGGLIHVGHRLVEAVERADGVRATFLDPHGDAAATVIGDAVIGADGIHSTLRRLLVPDDGPVMWNGSLMWRGATDWPAFLGGETMIVAGGSEAKLVVYPISEGRSPGTLLTNWAIVANVGDPGPVPLRREATRDAWAQHAVRSQLAPHVRRFASDVIDIAALVDATTNVFEYPMCDLRPLARWSHGRLTLLGDAAHAMYPMGSNGATQAILDGAALARHLAGRHDVATALRAYESERLEVTNALVLMNRRGGPERIIDIVEQLAPDGFATIDDVIAPAELRRIIADYTAAAGLGGPDARTSRIVESSR